MDLAATTGLETGASGTPRALGAAIEAHIAQLGLRVNGFEASFDAGSAVLHVLGCADSQDQRERVVLCCGNVRGVAAVDDRMTVLMPSEVSPWRFVQPGDTLARIAADHYRDPARAAHVRDANRPLLGDSDELQPGWRLRLPG